MNLEYHVEKNWTSRQHYVDWVPGEKEQEKNAKLFVFISLPSNFSIHDLFVIILYFLLKEYLLGTSLSGWKLERRSIR